MPRITVYRTPAGWMAHFENDQEVCAAFGTYTLPTAFTAHAEASRVLAAIQACNPNCEVVLA
jgi:hypothetical protein